MIVNRLNLDAAVAEGIISHDQAIRLQDLSERGFERNAAPIDFFQDVRDEPFRLLRGFRDFFIAIGVFIFSVGLSAITLTLSWQDSFFYPGAFEAKSGSGWTILIALALCLVGLAQAELITRRQRLPLSSLVLSVVFAAWSAYFAGLVAGNLVLVVMEGRTQALQVLNWAIGWSAVAGAILGVTFFYWRYRLPFALFLLAASIVALSLLVARDVMGAEWFSNYGRILIGLWGVAIFIGAMWFDLKDRLRVTRLSECAFWLHLFAAPMLVHALLFGDTLADPKLSFVLGTMAVLSFIALLIDRRALLVSGLSYFAIAISQIVSSSTLFGDQKFAATALIVGGAVLLLGLCWTQIRGGVLSVLPFDALRARLPPTSA